MGRVTWRDLDNMHHALGRPRSPDVDCHRNHFVISRDGIDARRFEATGCWDFVRTINSDQDAVYAVNGAGKAALAKAMKHPKWTGGGFFGPAKDGYRAWPTSTAASGEGR